MSPTGGTLPNEIIHMILLYCESRIDYFSQSLVNRAWFSEADLLKSLMKTRFARQITLPLCRFILWDFDIRLQVVGYGAHVQRHGREECVQAYHRVGGSGCSVYYLERQWEEGQLHGEEILREINEVWHDLYYQTQRENSHDTIDHPYNGLSAVDSMKVHRRHFLVPKNSPLPDRCDFLGRILFQHRWTHGTLEESNDLKRNFVDACAQSDVDKLYELIHKLDLSQTS